MQLMHMLKYATKFLSSLAQDFIEELLTDM